MGTNVPVSEAEGSGESSASIEELLAQRQTLQAEQEELQRQKERRELLDEVRRLRAENAAMKSSLQQPATPAPNSTITTAATSAAGVGGTPSTASTVPSLDDLRKSETLNQAVNAVIYGNANTGAIASTTASAGSNCTASAYTTTNQRGKVTVLSPENFAHRSGLSEIPYERLSIQEFVVGSLRIVLQGPITETEKHARLKHLLDTMVLASNYTWPSVRAMYGTALKEMEKGLRRWSDSLMDLKEEMLRPSDVVGLYSGARQGSDSSTKGDPYCRMYNFGAEGCSRGAKCSYRHVCADCYKAGKKDERHKARVCPNKEKEGSKND